MPNIINLAELSKKKKEQFIAFKQIAGWNLHLAFVHDFTTSIYLDERNAGKIIVNHFICFIYYSVFMINKPLYLLSINVNGMIIFHKLE